MKDLFKTIKAGEEGYKMKLYIYLGYGFFWDSNRREWVLYPVNAEGERIEEDTEGNEIEAEYFNNKKELQQWFLTKAKK